MAVAGKTSDHKVIEYELPKLDKDIGSVKSLHPDLRQLTSMLTVSASNALFRIEYSLEIFIKH